MLLFQLYECMKWKPIGITSWLFISVLLCLSSCRSSCRASGQTSSWPATPDTGCASRPRATGGWSRSWPWIWAASPPGTWARTTASSPTTARRPGGVGLSLVGFIISCGIAVIMTGYLATPPDGYQLALQPAPHHNITIPFTICTLSLIIVMLCYPFPCPYDTHCILNHPWKEGSPTLRSFSRFLP